MSHALSNMAAWRDRLAAVAGAIVCSLTFSSPVATQEFPPGVANPYEVMENPVYRDPVFWWRMTSVPDNVYEPDPYFYWPDAAIKGADNGKGGDFIPAAGPGETELPAGTLNALADWAEARDTYVLIIVHKGTVQLERYWQQGTPDGLTNGRAITRSVTPMVLGFAVADSALSLDDPIGT